jgi:transcriptional regulator with XRE-family HTH domain
MMGQRQREDAPAKIAAFLDISRESATKLAGQCQMTKAQLSRLKNRKSEPSIKSIRAIFRATGGVVRPDDWLTDDDLDAVKKEQTA